MMKSAPLSHAFEITADDVLSVLRSNSLKVSNSDGMPFEAMAESLLPRLNADLIATCAMGAEEMDAQTELAHDEIHRQLWEQGVIDCAPVSHIDYACRPTVRMRLAIEFSSQDPFELQRVARAGFKGLDAMTDRELACEAARLGVFETLKAQFRAMQVDHPQYIHGNWTHLFGPGSSETNVRILYDRESETLIAGQFHNGRKWVDLRRDDLLDVEDSLKNANPDTLENPSIAGFQASYGMPDWAQVSDGEAESPRRDAPRG